jgi:hypothetical protein
MVATKNVMRYLRGNVDSVRATAHPCVIAGLRACVLPEAPGSIVGLDGLPSKYIARPPYTYGPVQMSKDVLTDVLVRR